MKKRKGFNHFFMNLWRYKALVLMAVPGMLWMIFFFYIPVMANVVAFKNFHISADGFLASLRESPWVGWENFKFLFSSDQAFLITKNTILYNVAFILLNLLISVVFAIIMSELRNKRLVKVYQTMSLLPYFLSWVIISYFVYAFLSPDKGIFNQWITGHGGEAVNWYMNRNIGRLSWCSLVHGKGLVITALFTLHLLWESIRLIMKLLWLMELANGSRSNM